MSSRELAIQVMEGIIDRALEQRLKRTKTSGLYNPTNSLDPTTVNQLKISIARDLEGMLFALLVRWEARHFRPFEDRPEHERTNPDGS